MGRTWNIPTNQTHYVSNEDWNSSSEEDWQIESETYWDTDDEAEESKAIDDAYKILPGDWCDMAYAGQAMAEGRKQWLDVEPRS